MWVKNVIKMSAAAAILAAAIPAAQAQSSDRSPMLLIETGPSDSPEYRRMTFIKYLNGGGVTVAYKAYNRTEFSQVRDTTPREVAMKFCLKGITAGVTFFPTMTDTPASCAFAACCVLNAPI